MTKKAFIETYVTSLLKKITSNVSNCTYAKEKNQEYVVITYKNNDQYKINVTGDNNHKIVCAIFGHFAYK